MGGRRKEWWVDGWTDAWMDKWAGGWEIFKEDQYDSMKKQEDCPYLGLLYRMSLKRHRLPKWIWKRTLHL